MSRLRVIAVLLLVSGTSAFRVDPDTDDKSFDVENNDGAAVATVVLKDTELPGKWTAVPIKSVVSPDGRSAKVSLISKSGKEIVYELQSSNVFSEGASIKLRRGGGVVEHFEPSVSVFSFSSPSRAARAAIDDDGSVHGLFQFGGHLLEVNAHDPDQSKPALSALQVSSEGIAHHVRALRPSDLGLASSSEDAPQATSAMEEDELDLDAVAASTVDAPEVDVDDEGEEATSAEPPHPNWKGVKWWPGCYKGDEDMHVVKIGVLADHAAHKSFGDKTLIKELPKMVMKASMIFEAQMHIKLEIAEMEIATTTKDAPEWAVDCSSNKDAVGDKLAALVKDSTLAPLASWNLFTNCGNDVGTVGMAYVGGLCRSDKYNKGVQQIQGWFSWLKSGTWLTFAHEMGHQFGAHHSFEDGKQKTGGIMDYGNNKQINREYQFNTKYRREEVCKHLTDRIGKGTCKADNFFKEPAGTPIPTLPPQQKCWLGWSCWWF